MSRRRKGRLKNLFWGFSDDLFVFRHYKFIIASIMMGFVGKAHATLSGNA